MPTAAKPDTVYVGCRLPNGVVLELYGPKVEGIPPRPVKNFTLKGSRFPIDADNKPTKTWLVAGAEENGFGITEVPAELWDVWLNGDGKGNAGHKDWPPVASGMIFATGRSADTEQEARNREDAPPQLEPVDADRPAPGVEKVPGT